MAVILARDVTMYVAEIALIMDYVVNVEPMMKKIMTNE
jgi:hypothetical protein